MMAQFPGKGRRERNVVGSYLWPNYTAKSIGLFFLVSAVLAALGGLAQINSVWLYGPFHPEIVTTAAGPDWYAGWLEGYARSGRWDLQSHTAHLHREVEVAGGGSLPALTSLRRGESLGAYRARVRDDLGQASGAIARHTGRRPVAFAYPFGAYGADRTNHGGIRRVLNEELRRRYAVAFHQDEQERIPLLTGDEDLLGLRRLEVQDWSGMELLKRIHDASQHVARPRPPGIQGPGTGGVEMDLSVPVTVEEQLPSSMRPGVTPAPGLTGSRPGTVTRRPTLPKRLVPIGPGAIPPPTAPDPSFATPTAPTLPTTTSPTTTPHPTTTPTTAAPTPPTT